MSVEGSCAMTATIAPRCLLRVLAWPFQLGDRYLQSVCERIREGEPKRCERIASTANSQRFRRIGAPIDVWSDRFDAKSQRFDIPHARKNNESPLPRDSERYPW
jgi:hypothetical protein